MGSSKRRTEFAVLNFRECLKETTRRRLERAVREGACTKLHDGVIAMCPAPVDLLTTARGAVVWAGDELVASHAFAAWLHELDGSKPNLEFSLPRTAHYRAAPGMTIHRVASLPPEDIVEKRRFKATSLVRTVIDLASSSARRTVVMAYEHLHRRGYWYRERLVDRIDSMPRGFPGLELLRELSTRRPEYAPPTESAAEAICDDVLACAGIVPDRQHELFNRDGNFVARVDFAFPFLKLAIEVDGYATHSGRHAFYRDARRRQEILRLGWEVIPIVWADLQDEARLVRVVREIVDRRRLLFRSTAPIGPGPRDQLLLPL